MYLYFPSSGKKSHTLCLLFSPHSLHSASLDFQFWGPACSQSELAFSLVLSQILMLRHFSMETTAADYQFYRRHSHRDSCSVVPAF